MMMSDKAPWYASVLIAILHGLSVKYPDWHSVFQETINVLTILWFGHVGTAVSEVRTNGNGGK